MTEQQQSPWVRVSRKAPCIICQKPDWCTRGEKGACCMRVDSEKPMKNGGFFHAYDAERPAKPLLRQIETQPVVRPDFGAMFRRWREHEPAGKMAEIAAHLELSEVSLRMMGTAWSPHSSAIAFPMYDATCPDGSNPCGIRLRTMDGAKFAIKHSKSGIFFPYGALMSIRCHRIVICEGQTDTAAALDLGLFAIGRASCRGGEDIVLSVINQLAPKECVVVCDNDGPGVEGANELMKRISIPKTRFVPPTKDLRSFVREGGTRELLETMLKNTLRK